MQEGQGRPMRRADRAVSIEETEAFLSGAEYGVLSLNGEDGAPYGVPLSFVYMRGSIYFHCAMEGHKTACMQRDPRASFVAAGEVKAIYNGNFTTHYKSAMAGGRVAPVTDDAEKRDALAALCVKYLPDHSDDIDAALDRALAVTAVWKLTPDWITGKANLPKEAR